MKKNLLYLVFAILPFLSQANIAVTSTVYSTTPGQIKLLSFTGNKNDNNSILEWKTAEEIGFSHFELERSNDGKEFSTIAIIFSGVAEYSFKDVNAFKNKEIVNYRLKLIDNKGDFIYSSVIKVPQ